MTAHKFALSDLAARLAGTDASLSTALRDILSTALQELMNPHAHVRSLPPVGAQASFGTALQEAV